MDDLNHIGIEMERECLVSTFQTLVENVGSEVTMKLLRPYFEISGKAFALNLRDWTRDDDVFQKLGKIAVIAIAPWGYRCTGLMIANNELIVKREGCPFLGILPEICESLCKIMWGAGLKQIDPELEVELIPGACKDDPRCITRNYYRTNPLLFDSSEKNLDIESILRQIPQEEVEWRAHHYASGVWCMVTHAMVNGLDSEMVLGPLSNQMRRIGFSCGLRIKDQLGIEGRDLDSISMGLDRFGKEIMQEHTSLSTEPDELEVQVDVCQWSGHDFSTPEFCQLIESINDGVCKSINPEYEFRYCSMKTRGDDKCVWTVKKKSPAKKGQASESQNTFGEQDPLTLLKIRLAKGEITLEQYEKIAQVLK